MLPEELKKGDRLTADYLNRLVRAVVARTVNAGPGLRKTQTPAGTTLSLAPQRRGGAGETLDFAWKATLEPQGADGSTAKISFRLPRVHDMIGGQTYTPSPQYVTVSDSATISARVNIIATGPRGVVSIHSAPATGTDPSPPSDDEMDFPVAEVEKATSNGQTSWKLAQLQFGVIHIIHMTDEEA